MIEGGERESKDEKRGADGSKETVPSDGVEQEVVDSFNKKGCRTLGAVEAQENLPSKVVDTGSKDWSYKQPKSEEICLEADLGVNDDERETGEFIEERLSRLGLGNHRDGAAKKSDLKVGEDESRIVSRSILDECVQMVVEERGLLKKDGFKGIFDADDDVLEGRNEDSNEGVKSGTPPRSNWEVLRPSSTPRLAAWLLKAGASEAQVLILLFYSSSLFMLGVA